MQFQTGGQNRSVTDVRLELDGGPEVPVDVQRSRVDAAAKESRGPVVDGRAIGRIDPGERHVRKFHATRLDARRRRQVAAKEAERRAGGSHEVARGQEAHIPAEILKLESSRLDLDRAEVLEVQVHPGPDDEFIVAGGDRLS